VDTELVYAYAKTNALGDLDTFIHGTHQVGDARPGPRPPVPRGPLFRVCPCEPLALAPSD
jgi:hypothetical protein